MKTPLSYYGGKLNMVNDILPLLDYDKKQFVSLFTGGGAVEIAKSKHEVEVWNDIDANVITFWEVLQSDKLYCDLEKKIKATLHAEFYHSAAKDILKNKEGFGIVEIAWATWVQCSMSFSNAMFNGFAFANDNSRNLQTANKRERFSKLMYDRVRLIQIFNRDAISLLELKDTPDTHYFADPPYVESDCGHYKGKFTELAYNGLLDKLGKIKGTFLLTTYPSDTLEYYRKKYGWQVQDKKVVLSVDGRRAETKYKTECITYNYEKQTKLNLFDG